MPRFATDLYDALVSLTPMDEPALIRDAQRGDVNAFNRLVLEYQALAYNVAYRVMGEAEAAEDATQDREQDDRRRARAGRRAGHVDQPG